MRTIIVTRHEGAKEWIRKHHPEFENVEVISHAVPGDLVGNRVIGVLPVNLAALCGEYWHLSMNIPQDMRGKELTCDDMETFGCEIEQYLIDAVPPSCCGWYHCPECGTSIPMTPRREREGDE